MSSLTSTVSLHIFQLLCIQLLSDSHFLTFASSSALESSKSIRNKSVGPHKEALNPVRTELEIPCLTSINTLQIKSSILTKQLCYLNLRESFSICRTGQEPQTTTYFPTICVINGGDARQPEFMPLCDECAGRRL